MIKMFFFCRWNGCFERNAVRKQSVDTIPAVCTSNLTKVELHKVHFKCKEAERVVNLVKAIHHSVHAAAAAAAAESSVKMQNPYIGSGRGLYLSIFTQQLSVSIQKETLISIFMMIRTFLEHKMSPYADDSSTSHRCFKLLDCIFRLFTCNCLGKSILHTILLACRTSAKADWPQGEDYQPCTNITERLTGKTM